MAKEVSEQERERRRKQAVEMHREVLPDGRRKFGGPQPGSGRPRKKRASEIIAEKTATQAQDLWNELSELRKDKSSAVRLKAILSLLDIEERERFIRTEEEKELGKLRKDELLERIMEMMERMGKKGIIPDFFDLEGDAEEIAPAEIEAA